MDVFRYLRSDLVQRMGRPAATAALVGLLRQAKAEDLADDGFQREAWQAIKQVNLWHATSFGGFGWDPRSPSSWQGGQFSGLNWPQIVADVVKWYDAGNGRGPATAPGEPPAGAEVVERTFAQSGQPQSYVDLDAGGALELPKDLQRTGPRYGNYQDLRKAQQQWREANSVDVHVSGSSANAYLNLWMPSSPVPVQWWASAGRAEVGRALAAAVKQEYLNTRDLGPLPLLLAFRTDQGRDGLLLISAAEGGKGVTFRWRWASSPPAPDARRTPPAPGSVQ